MSRLQVSSEFLRYLTAMKNGSQEEPTRLPSLNDISKELGVSVAILREQVEVAKALGLVEVRPRTGIRRLPYSFLPAVRQSLACAIEADPANFVAYAELRANLEAAFWQEAVKRLTQSDHQTLNGLMAKAWEKLHNEPIQIPHTEHRELHLCIFSRLENPFVTGLLEAYWDAYEAVGFNLYADYPYLQQVWTYHQKMVDAICSGDLPAGYAALVEHKDLLYHRKQISLEETKN